MSNVIRIEARGQYGRTVYHPANDEARALAEIAGTKTLTPAALKVARERLGFEIKLEVEAAAHAAAELGLDAWENNGEVRS